MKTLDHWEVRRISAWAPVMLAVALLLGTSACRSGKDASGPGEERLSLTEMTPIFGEPSGVRSGLADFSQSDTEILLTYHLNLADRTNIDLEIARDLAPKIRKLYGHFKNVDRAAFGVYLPDQDTEQAWKPYVSFVMTRKLIKETGWSDLLDTELLRVALDVKRAD